MLAASAWGATPTPGGIVAAGSSRASLQVSAAPRKKTSPRGFRQLPEAFSSGKRAGAGIRGGRAAPCPRRLVVVASARSDASHNASRVTSTAPRSAHPRVSIAASAFSSLGQHHHRHRWAPSDGLSNGGSSKSQTQQRVQHFSQEGIRRRRRGERKVAFAAEATSASGGTAETLPPPRATESRKQLWSKLSTAVNVLLVATVVWFALSSFLTASPQFTARLNDLFNSRAFHRVSSAFSTLPAHNWAALEHQLGHHPWRTAAIMTGRGLSLTLLSSENPPHLRYLIRKHPPKRFSVPLFFFFFKPSTLPRHISSFRSRVCARHVQTRTLDRRRKLRPG